MGTNNSEIARWRQKIMEREMEALNDRQRLAVQTVSGPLLILAGAGSGKTTVLVNRIAHLLRWGEAFGSPVVYGEYTPEEKDLIRRCSEEGGELPEELVRRLSVYAPEPWRILAITFTNKAAGELKDRICAKVGEEGLNVWASTFHSACGRILRASGNLLGYSSHFTVYDGDDQKRMVKECLKALRFDEKMLAPKTVLHEISSAKDRLITPEQYAFEAGNDAFKMSVAKVYKLYQDRLIQADAMDFDDMIFNTVVLLRDYEDVRRKYAGRFEYIMVDEYQDTNHAQYELVRLLSSMHGNLCVVGDDDQSIYRFRGATTRNILEFESTFTDAKVIKLEQNYRSTETILSAANAVIRNNSQRKDKTLWTRNPLGRKILRYNASDERDEARFIADTINEQKAKGADYSDFAVLYRMNSQSQTIERALVRASVPYRIVGGRRFYDRREIRDMIAYLSVISNIHDSTRLKRIINIPKRGIGDKSVDQIEEISLMMGTSMIETMEQAEEFAALTKNRTRLKEFAALIREMIHKLETGTPISEMYKTLVERIEYIPFILKESDNGNEAVENVRELTSTIVRYEQEHPDDASLQGFLEEIALLSDIDSYNTQEEDHFVVLMTLHSAKGLEFNHVFIPGMDESTFPSYMALMSSEEMEEERRLAYVGITRAKRDLTLITARVRTLFGKTNYNKPSRFLSELPAGLVEERSAEVPVMRSFSASPAPAPAQRFIPFHQTETPAPTGQVFSVGMRIFHKIFGEGTVLSVRPMGSDTLLEIAFDVQGTKRIMANYSKLTIL